MPSAHLDWKVDVNDPAAVVLVLHGGRSRGRGAVRPWHGAVLRMLPFVGELRRAGEGRVAVATLRYAVRGWNGSAASPVADARSALDEVAARYPGLPLGLLGHSMGGRVAFRLAGDDRVAALVALAPWVERSDVAMGHPGLRALVMHGTRDRITSPRNSKAMADAMSALGVDVTWRAMEGESHSMLRQAAAWHRESAQFLVEGLNTRLHGR